MPDTTCPPLGTGSVDLHALHEAAVAGAADLPAAVAAATTRDVAEPGAEAPLLAVPAPLPDTAGDQPAPTPKPATQRGR